MNPIGLAMDALLMGLLLLALAMGLRLSRQLKALRAGQGDFVRAVGELDAAALRAEAGLAELRRATEETHDSLLARIDTARGLIERLGAAVAEADAAQSRERQAPVAAPALSSRTPAGEGHGRERLSPSVLRVRSGSERGERNDLAGLAPETETDSRAGALMAELQRRRARRPAPEDELFADAGAAPRRAAGDRG